MGGGGGSTIGMIVGAIVGAALIYFTVGAATPFVAGWWGATATGAVLFGAAVGAGVGGIAGGLIAPASFDGAEVAGPQIVELQIMGVAEGAGVHLCFGENVRVAGQLIYAGDLVETKHTETHTVSGKSFLAGTPVGMADGSMKPIEEVEVGDMVLSRQFRRFRCDRWTARPVTKTTTSTTTDIVVFHVNDFQIQSTPSHEVYGLKPSMPGEWHWFQARSLCPGDSLLTLEGPVEVEKVEVVNTPSKTYNFTVGKDHNYTVGGVLVHNTGGGGGSGGSTSTWYTYSCDMAVAVCEGPIAQVSRIYINGKNIYAAPREASVTAPDDCTSLKIDLIMTWSGGWWNPVFAWTVRVTVVDPIGDDPFGVLDVGGWASGQEVTLAGFENEANNRTVTVITISDDTDDDDFIEFEVEGSWVMNDEGTAWVYDWDGMSEVVGDTSSSITTTTLSHSAKAAKDIRQYIGNDGTADDVGHRLSNDEPDSILTSSGTYGDDETGDDVPAPSYRGIAYVAFDNLELADFGNQIPQCHFVVDCRHADVMKAGETQQHAADAIDRLMIRAGRTKANGIGGVFTAGDHFDSDAIRVYDMDLRGYAISGPKSTTTMLSNLIIAYDVMVQEDGGILRFLKRGDEATATINESHLAAVATDGGGNAPPSKFVISDQPETALPNEINIDYFDVNDKYQRGSQKAQRTVQGVLPRVDKIDVPLVLTATEAQAIANRILYQTHAVRTVVAFSLPPKYVTLNENDILTVPVNGEAYKVRVLEINRGADFLMEVRGLITEGSTTTYSGDADDGTTTPDVPYIPPMMRAVMLDTPALRNADVSSPGLYAVGYTINPDTEFKSGSMWNSLNQSGGYENIASMPSEGFVFTVTNELGDGPVNQWDNLNTLSITVLAPTTAHSPSSTTDEGVFTGSNMCVIGGEMIQFKSAVPVPDTHNRYVLYGLLRGRRDSLDFMSGHEANEPGVLLTHANSTGVLVVNYDADYLYTTQYYKSVSVGQDVADAISTSDQGLATRCKPFRPCNVRARRNEADDWTIQWTRTDRAMFRLFSQAQNPLSETYEDYRVEILDPENDDAVVQTLTQTASPNGSLIELAQMGPSGGTERLPQATFTRADQEAYTTDGGTTFPWDSAAGPPDTIKVNIWQRGGVHAKGNVRTETLTFPADY